MYLRSTKRQNRDGSTVEYYALAENVWNKAKQRSETKVIHSFGRADSLDRDVLERLAHSIRRVLIDGGIDRAAVSGEPVQVADIVIDRVFDLGVVHVAKAMWDKLGIGEAIQKRVREKKLKAPHEAALFAMAAQRLDRPGSKLACHERWLDRVWLPEAKDLGLYQLYRAMDLLAEHGDAIEEEVFWNSADLFKLDVDLVFYDATTAWFETDDEDVASHEWRGLKFEPLRKRGHSKEGRDNDPQVIIALAVSLDDKGRPYLDKDKVKRAEHLDGKFVLTTNDDTLSVADIALGYKGMWIIENCFRKMKTTGLEVRPMFHWMPQRITAHVKLCVLALMIQRAVELGTEMTWTNIRTAVETLKAVSYRTEKQAIVQTTNPTQSAAAILKKLDITKPKTIISIS